MNFGEKTYKMKMREMETAFKYRRFPYPKRSVELIALLAISCTFFLFMHTNKLNSRLKEMEMKLQPSEFSALGLTGSNHLDSPKHEDINTLHGTYQYLKSTGQLFYLNANHLNNTKKAEVDILFYNRVPKTGSMQLIALLRQLGKLHDFLVDVDPNNGGIRASLDRQEEEDTIDNILNLDDGTAFVSHMNFMNFTEFNQPKPIYINMVRDPVERVISWYYYIRSPWIFVPGRKKNNRPMPNPKWVNTDFDECVLKREKACTFIEGAGNEGVGDHRRQTLFFCGNKAKKCMPFNMQIPLELAKRNVEKEYAVVGTWEDTNVTLSVFENYVPRYFKGATKLYYNGLNNNLQNNNPFKPHFSAEIKQMVRQNFTREMEFYYFCRQRLYRQYLALKKDELKAVLAKTEKKNESLLSKAIKKFK